MSQNKWLNGIADLIRHGIEHLSKDNDSDSRIGYISIDNATELAIKIYLSNNRRQFGMSLKDLNKYKTNFPGLLDGLQKHALDKVTLEDLDEIEQYHMIRNTLYHNGAFITVEKTALEQYILFSKYLIETIFETELDLGEFNRTQIYQQYGEFMAKFGFLSLEISRKSGENSLKVPFSKMLKNIRSDLSPDLHRNIVEIRSFRNIILHNNQKLDSGQLTDYIQKIDSVLADLKN